MHVPAKKSLTRKTCNHAKPSLDCQVGGKPEPFRTHGKLRLFRQWQDAAFKKLLDQWFAIMNAPTGGGKSVVQKSLAYEYARRGERTVIAVPETTIGASFKTEVDDAGEVLGYRLPNKTVMHWVVPAENMLFQDAYSVTTQGTVQRVKDFVLNGRATVEGRVLVCTHAALVRAHQQLVKEYGADAWKGVNVFIDETHHSKCEELVGDEDDEEVRKLRNALGSVVAHYVAHKPGRLMLTTATWLRGDAMEIVPPSSMSNFVLYELPIDEYLQKMEHLRTISFKFSIEKKYETVLRREVEADPHAKTLVYLPHVMPGEQALKVKRLTACQKALGPAKRDDFMLAHALKPRTTVHSMDLVTLEGRDQIRTAFENDKNRPDVIFV